MTKMLLALVLTLTSCTTAPPSRPPDASPPCDLVSCAAGMALECCPPIAPPSSTTRTAIVSTLDAVPQYGWEQAFGGPANKYLGCMRSTSAGSFEIASRIDVGDRLLSFTAEVTGNASADLTIVARRRVVDLATDTTAIDDIGSVSVPNAPASITGIPVDVVDTLATADTSIWIEVSASAAGLCVGAFRLTYDHPQ